LNLFFILFLLMTQSQQFRDKEKPKEVRGSNIVAGRAVADAIRTSLGPKGMDKMVRCAN
jgi:T-complex protein 1 subunit delta